MPNKKACVVFTVGLEEELLSVTRQLSDAGYDVCAAGADEEIVQAAK